jgi:hypothetical protein
MSLASRPKLQLVAPCSGVDLINNQNLLSGHPLGHPKLKECSDKPIDFPLQTLGAFSAARPRPLAHFRQVRKSFNQIVCIDSLFLLFIN